MRLLLVIALGAFSATSAADSVILTSLAKIQDLPLSEAAKHKPVKVIGVVTWCYPGRLPGGFMIDQDGAGIFVTGEQDLPDGRTALPIRSARTATTTSPASPSPTPRPTR